MSTTVLTKRIRRKRRYMFMGCTVLALGSLLASSVFIEDMQTVAGRENNPMPGRMVDVGDHRIHVIKEGTGGPTVVLEAGSGEVASGWDEVATELSGGSTVARYDRAGTGWSEPANGPRTSSAIVSDLHAAHEEIDAPRPYVLVGHSLGGLYVRDFVREHPGEVAGLVLVDARPEDDAARTASIVPDGAGTSSLPTWIPSTLKAIGALRAFNGALLEGLVPQAQRQEFLNVTASPSYFSTQRDEADHIAPTERALAGQDLGDMPVIVIARGKPQDYESFGVDAPTSRALERVWQDGQQRMLALSTKSKFVVAENSGHLIPMEQPDVIVEQVRALLAELET